MVASGGVVYSAAADGQLYILDADTGKFIQKKFFGVALGTQPTLGQTGTGKVRLIQTNGLGFTGGGLGSIPGTPGAVMVFGLPDQLPQPQVITKEVIKGGTKRSH